MKRLPQAIAVLLVALGVRAAAGAGPGSDLGPVAMESYRQEFVVTFKSEALARKAGLRIAPLYHDLQAAFSTRMDDSTLNDVVVADLMPRYGQRGTFYLNDPAKWYQDSPATGVTMPSDPASVVPARLLASGSSIGGHTLTHEMLPALNKNAAFHEIMGARVTLESRVGTPVSAFVYPFVDYRSALRDGVDRSDLEEMLRRSGYYFLAEDSYNRDWGSGFLDGSFIVLDGQSGGGRYTEDVITKPRDPEARPLFLVTMHAWVSNWGAPGFPKLAALYEKWAGRKDWWYCNQNQYGAYRYQALYSRLATFVEGRTLRAVLIRPSPLDLNDWTPLTFRVEGVARDDVVGVSSARADAPAVAAGDAYEFDLSHDRNLGRVDVYTLTHAEAGETQREGPEGGLEGLVALLRRKDGELVLSLHNGGPRALRDIRVTFRMPLRWAEGVVRRNIAQLQAGSSETVKVPLTESSGAGFTCGAEYDAAQIDFVGARRARLYATCESEPKEADARFASRGFWFLGALPGDRANFDPVAFTAAFMKGEKPEPTYNVPWVGAAGWRVLPPAKAAILDPDIIPTTAKPNTPDAYPADRDIYSPHKNALYLLYGRVYSGRDQAVYAVFQRDSVKALSLNGRPVDGSRLELKKGANDVRILYAPSVAASAYTEANYGCYFRLVDAGGARVEDVHFDRPSLP